ncbi:MAG: von Willebrand factor type A domain-containing protein [Myxococcota bacterium]
MTRVLRLACILAIFGAASAMGCGGAERHLSGSAGYADHSGAEPMPSPEEAYSHTGESPVVESQQDALATFSLDVDTASYTIMRRDLRAGHLPAPQSVRVEEYLNFFDFSDPGPAPESDTPFAVHLETAPAPFGANKHLLRVGVRAMDVPAQARPQTNLVFLVDVSGSMASSEKLGLVQYSLRHLAQNLRPSDRVAIVTYAGSDAVVLHPTELRDRTAIDEGIAALRAGGGTNGAAGIRTAYDLAAQHLVEGGIHRVVLCTDGDFNVGLTGEGLIREVEARRRQGITLSVFGFGRGNLNDAFMEQLADRGNGNYGFIDTRQEANRALGRDLSATLHVVAKDAKVQVEFNAELVQSHRIIGYDNRILAYRDFDNDQVDAAEVGAGDYVTAYLEIELRDGVDLRQEARPLAEVRLRYKDADGDQSYLRTYPFRASDAVERFADATAAFRFGAAVAEYAEILAGSEHAAGSELADVARIAEAAIGQREEQREFVELVRVAQQLSNAQ